MTMSDDDDDSGDDADDSSIDNTPNDGKSDDDSTIVRQSSLPCYFTVQGFYSDFTENIGDCMGHLARLCCDKSEND